MNKIILVANALLWLITLIYWYKKRGFNHIGFIIILLYTIIACVGIHLYEHPYSLSSFAKEIKIIPFVYLYIMIMLLIVPLLRVDNTIVKCIYLPNEKIIKYCCIYIILCSCYKLFDLLPNLSNGLSILYSNAEYVQDLYDETTKSNLTAKSLTGSFNLLSIFTNFGINISMLFFFIYLLYPEKNKMIIYGMFFALIINPLSSLANGSRELVIVTIIMSCFLFFLFKPFYTQKIKKILVTIFTITLFLFISSFIVITIIRFSNNERFGGSMLYSYEYYIGQSFLVFNGYCMDVDGTREGTMVAPLLMKLFGGNVYSQEEVRFIYKNMGIDNSRFSTFVGDFVLDFGPLITFIIILLAYYYFNKRLKCISNMYLGHFILLYILIKILSGFYLHQFTGVGGNLLLIELFILYKLFSRKSILYKKFKPIIVENQKTNK